MSRNKKKLRKLAPILIDSYKLGHITMYPKGTSIVYPNMTPRSLRHFDKIAVPKYNDSLMVMYGTRLAMEQVHELYDTYFFSLPKDEVLQEFKEAVQPFIGDNSPDGILKAIGDLHDLGYLPLLVKWLPEGTLAPAGIPMLTIKNTDESFAWLPNYLETLLSSETWKKATAATIARHYRLICEDFAEQTCDDNFHVTYQCHDFSCRGMSGHDDFIMTGTGHLTQFQGSDSIGSAYLIKNVYSSKALVACSVPATEHSVMQLGSSSETETETFRRLIKQYNKGIVSIVSDTWDFWDTITVKALELKDEILAREEDSLGLSKVVFRPDTGNPADVICGELSKYREFTDEEELNDWLCDSKNLDGTIFKFNDTYYELSGFKSFLEGYGSESTETDFRSQIDSRMNTIEPIEIDTTSPEAKGAVECLWETFGGTVNDKGFKVLNPKVGLIYGDSITPQRAVEIFQRLKDKGFASSNIVLGVGSYTYQYNTRDTLGFAIKVTYAEINQQGFNVFKAPKTDSGKNSAKGLLAVHRVDNKLVLKQECTIEEEMQGLLEIGYCNGGFIEEVPSWDDIRERAQA